MKPIAAIPFTFEPKSHIAVGGFVYVNVEYAIVKIQENPFKIVDKLELNGNPFYNGICANDNKLVAGILFILFYFFIFFIFFFS